MTHPHPSVACLSVQRVLFAHNLTLHEYVLLNPGLGECTLNITLIFSLLIHSHLSLFLLGLN